MGRVIAALLRPGRRSSRAPRWPRCWSRIEAARAASPACSVANVFHAGDGNLHPLVCYDGHVPARPSEPSGWPARSSLACVDAGGSITGEHGVGVDKKRVHAEDVRRGRPGRLPEAALRLRPRRPRQPRQGDADAAAVRRGPRPLPPPPARGRPAWRSGSEAMADAAAPAQLTSATAAEAACRALRRGRRDPDPRRRHEARLGAGRSTRRGARTRATRRARRAQRRRPHRGPPGRPAARPRAGGAGGRRADAARSTRPTTARRSAASSATGDSGPLRHRYGGAARPRARRAGRAARRPRRLGPARR